jgi:hypothetical protein
LPGIRELTNVTLVTADVTTEVMREFVRRTGWDLAPGDWTAPEKGRVDQLVAEKYGLDSWNRKR